MNTFRPSKTNAKSVQGSSNGYEITCIVTDLVLSSLCKEIFREFTFELPFIDLEDCSTIADCRAIPNTERIIYSEIKLLSPPCLYNIYTVIGQQYAFTIHCLAGDIQFTRELIFPVLCTQSLSRQGPFDLRVQVVPSYCTSSLTTGDISHRRVTGEEPGEQFAFAVVFNNNPPAIIVGSPSASLGAVKDAGKVTFLSYPQGEELLQVFGSAAEDELGVALDAGFDLNGDGWSDILAGAPSAQVGSAIRAGYIRVLSGLDGSTLLQVDNTEAEAQFGWSVSWAGDLNGDLVPDFLVGAPQASPGAQVSAGSVFAYSGATGTLLYSLDGENADDAFGYAVKMIGDVDGDGIPDFAVGAPFASPAGLDQAGIVYVHSGAGGALLYKIEGTEINAGLGFSIGAMGDVNGDGIPDILVGAPDSSPGGLTEAGSAYIFSGLDGSLLQQFSGTSSAEETGIAVSAIGNFDNDGLPDVALGAPSFSFNNTRFAGKVYLVSSSTGQVLHVFKENTSWAQFGWSVAGTGEVNSRSIFIGSPGIDALDIYQLGLSRMYCAIHAAVILSLTKKADILISAISTDNF